ncbi:MAG: trigger factor family protein, partial [Deltaproteobacteria bacterium]|nr:trigger factor family protein [Deltaproteobacteria bacterium]
MPYTVEDLTPVRKKIEIRIPSDEVDAALSRVLEFYRSSLTLKGFRKGKAPSAMVEKRFSREIHSEASAELLHNNLETALREKSFIPVSRLDISPGEASRGEEFICSVSFEVMPEFTLPPHLGLPLEQKEPRVEEREVEAALERLRERLAKILPLEEERLPMDNDLARIDFDGLDD